MPRGAAVGVVSLISGRADAYFAAATAVVWDRLQT